MAVNVTVSYIEIIRKVNIYIAAFDGAFPAGAFPEIEVTQRPNKGKDRLTIDKGLFGACP